MKKYKHRTTGAIAEWVDGAGYYVTLDNVSHGYFYKGFIENSNDWIDIENPDVKTVGEVKTAREVLQEKFDSPEHRMADMIYGSTLDMVLDAMREYASQFKSSSKSEGSEAVEKCNSCGSKKVEIIHRCKCGIEW